MLFRRHRLCRFSAAECGLRAPTVAQLAAARLPLCGMDSVPNRSRRRKEPPAPKPLDSRGRKNPQLTAWEKKRARRGEAAVAAVTALDGKDGGSDRTWAARMQATFTPIVTRLTAYLDFVPYKTFNPDAVENMKSMRDTLVFAMARFAARG